MQFRRMLLVRQYFPDRGIQDVPAEVDRQLSRAAFAARLKPGSRIAIGVGSRGIANIATIVRSVVAFWRSKGMQPFIFPAMGSHGAASAEGQADVLKNYGIQESTVGCPVISSLEVVPLGKTPEGLETFMDRQAYESDGVFLVNRVKWHTDFVGKIESGLFKMMAIGLGKFAGAQRYHACGYRIGLEEMILQVGRQVLKSSKILGGLAILEDANHATAHLEAVVAEEMERRDEELLVLVKSWMGRIPVQELEILIVDQIGKEISGAGMDTKIVNRSINCAYNPWSNAPLIHRIFVRDLSRLTYGNGVGVGMADVVHGRVLEKIDWTPTHINSLTSSTPACIRTPIHFPSDRECLQKIAATVGKLDPREIRVGWIRDTMQLNLLALSENLLPEIQQNPDLQVLGPPRDLEFDRDGNLASLLVPAGEPAWAW